MNKRKIVAFAVITLLVLITAFVIKNRSHNDHPEQGFVFDKSSNIKLKDIETYYRYVDFKEERARDYFKDSAVNPYTIKFFMFLSENFKEFDNEKDLFENVRKYLSSIMTADMADKLFDLYKKFVKYQLSLGDKSREWGMPKTVDETIDFLHKIQNYRREIFGRDVADILFGASVKAEEYPLRRGAILNDKNMYGAEKETRMNQLNEAMWGDEADQVDAYAETYIKYREKLAMYEKDLSEMSEEAKKAQIRTFREEIFTPDQVRSFEEVDKAIADNEQKEHNYRARESEIMNDSGLTTAEKENKVRELQNQMYGDESDALRRRLAIERASEARLKK